MKRVFLFSFIILLPLCMYAQKQTWNWAFGKNCGLSWQPDQLRSYAATGIDGTPNATLDNLPGTFTTNMSNLEGVFSMSDKDGNLLFYSNGMQIWNAAGTSIYSDLGGHSSSAQSGIVVPYPGDEKKFIAIGLGMWFANNMGYVIIQANSPSDVSVVGSRVAFSGHTALMGESMTAIMHANGQDWWIVAPSRGNSGMSYLNAWLATPNGIEYSTPKVTSTEINFTGTNGSHGYIKFTPNGKHFVWGTWTEKKLIFGDFNSATGEFSNIQFINNHGAYGVEFSPNQKYLYTAINNSSALDSETGLYRWDFQALLNQTTTSYEKFIPNSSLYPTWTRGLGGLQLDCTGRMWTTSESNSESTLIVIDNPDDPDNLKIYLLKNFVNGIPQLGFPSFSATFFSLGGDKGFCINTEKEFSTSISPTVNGGTVAYTIWGFGDGSVAEKVEGSGTQKKSHTYKRPGDYTITVSAYNTNNVLLDSQAMDIKVNPCALPVNHNIGTFR